MIITKEQFKDIIELIQQYEKEEIKFVEALDSCFGIGLGISGFIESNNLRYALLKIIQATIDPDKYIEGWLYDLCGSNIIYKEGKKYVINTADELYDFLLEIYK